MRPYTTYNPLTGRVAVGLPVALPERGLVVVVEAAWGDTSDPAGAERVRLDPLSAYREQRAAACGLAEVEMARLAARAMRREDERMAARWRRGCALVRRHGERLRAGAGGGRLVLFVLAVRLSQARGGTAMTTQTGPAGHVGGDLLYEVAETDDGDYTILDTRTGAAMMAPTTSKRLAFEHCGALNRQAVVRRTREMVRQPQPRILNLEARRRFDASQRPAAVDIRSVSYPPLQAGGLALTHDRGRSLSGFPSGGPESVSHETGPADLMTSCQPHGLTSVALVRPVGSHPNKVASKRDLASPCAKTVSPQRVCLTRTLILPQGEGSMSPLYTPEGLKPAQASGAPPTAEACGHPRLKDRSQVDNDAAGVA